jgi:hypothetical protein
MSETQKRPFEELWDLLDEAEANAPRILYDLLYDYGGALRSCCALGVELPYLPESQAIKTKLSLRVAALFLKRVLNDLRGVWLLVARGYTSQAACVAASLWENSLVVTCVAGNEERANQCVSDDDGQIPWKPQVLAKIHAETRMKGATEEERVTEELITYSFYRWLCRVKHPTLPSVTHDSFSAGAGSEGGYLLMAFPDVRPEDLPVKTFLLMISGLNVVHAIESFCEVVRDERHQSNEWLNFRFRLRTAAEAILSVGEMHLKDATHPLPFKLSRRFREGANARLANSRFLS